MEQYLIKGGIKLKGSIRACGAKNAVLKLMTATLMTKGNTIISNVPKIKDVYTMAEVIKTLGAKVDLTEADKVKIDTTSFLNCEAPYELVRQMRASIIVLGPLLARLGKARVAMPGGCNIGSRKIDLHIRGLEELGARFEVGHGYIDAKASRLKGTTIPLDFPSVGATENLLMAATMAQGTTVIENAAREPEVVDLINFLNKMGAKIKGGGTSTLKIKGVSELDAVEYSVIPDRIEAATFLIAGAITCGDVLVENARPEHLELVTGKLREAGVEVEEAPEGVRVSLNRRPNAVDIATLPYPGFPTDLQAQMMILLSLADEISVVTENVFENRFIFVDELNRMGCNIRTEGHHAIVRGAEMLSGAPVKASDLRGGAALVLAGLAAEGVTEVSGVYHIDRGYENFEQKLRSLGADIIRIREGENYYQVQGQPA